MSAKQAHEITYLHLPDDASWLRIEPGRADADGVAVMLRIGKEPTEKVVFIRSAEQLDRLAEEAARCADWMRRAQVVRDALDDDRTPEERGRRL